MLRALGFYRKDRENPRPKENDAHEQAEEQQQAQQQHPQQREENQQQEQKQELMSYQRDDECSYEDLLNDIDELAAVANDAEAQVVLAANNSAISDPSIEVLLENDKRNEAILMAKMMHHNSVASGANVEASNINIPERNKRYPFNRPKISVNYLPTEGGGNSSNYNINSPTFRRVASQVQCSSFSQALRSGSLSFTSGGGYHADDGSSHRRHHGHLRAGSNVNSTFCTPSRGLSSPTQLTSITLRNRSINTRVTLKLKRLPGEGQDDAGKNAEAEEEEEKEGVMNGFAGASRKVTFPEVERPDDEACSRDVPATAAQEETTASQGGASPATVTAAHSRSPSASRTGSQYMVEEITRELVGPAGAGAKDDASSNLITSDREAGGEAPPPAAAPASQDRYAGDGDTASEMVLSVCPAVTRSASAAVHSNSSTDAASAAPLAGRQQHLNISFPEGVRSLTDGSENGSETAQLVVRLTKEEELIVRQIKAHQRRQRWRNWWKSWWKRLIYGRSGRASAMNSVWRTWYEELMRTDPRFVQLQEELYLQQQESEHRNVFTEILLRQSNGVVKRIKL